MSAGRLCFHIDPRKEPKRREKRTAESQETAETDRRSSTKETIKTIAVLENASHQKNA